MGSSGAQPHDWREWRRMRALDLARQGWKQREIALALDASEGAVSRWLAAARRGGPDALRSHPAPGPAAKLTPEQLRLIPDFLWHGAEAYGFRGDVWTCERVAGVIGEEFGVSYSTSQVSRLLKRLGWTPQVPITRAIQRDEEAIARWRAESWPALKERARREHRALVFVDESGFYLLPGAVKTYAPRGRTPIVDEWQTRDHLSVMGGVTVQGKVYSLVRPTSLSGLHTIEFLVHLGRQGADRLLVIWDGSPIHRRAEVKACVAEAGDAIHVEPLPPYAPDLNPVEWLWRQVKEVELRNLTCLDLEQVHMELHLALGRVRQKPALVRSFFEGAGLGL
ncbi:MAG TPA: IS630 family transposase [Acidimicrobiales bacterium]|nr:IS630 family transposase [Acidimicrobiales bacterium]